MIDWMKMLGIGGYSQPGGAPFVHSAFPPPPPGIASPGPPQGFGQTPSVGGGQLGYGPGYDPLNDPINTQHLAFGSNPMQMRPPPPPPTMAPQAQDIRPGAQYGTFAGGIGGGPGAPQGWGRTWQTADAQGSQWHARPQSAPGQTNLPWQDQGGGMFKRSW